jgi:hypothetical protein
MSGFATARPKKLRMAGIRPPQMLAFAKGVEAIRRWPTLPGGGRKRCMPCHLLALRHHPTEANLREAIGARPGFEIRR